MLQRGINLEWPPRGWGYWASTCYLYVVPQWDKCCKGCSGISGPVERPSQNACTSESSRPPPSLEDDPGGPCLLPQVQTESVLHGNEAECIYQSS